ncbi:hypothetical protein HDU98_003270 [Podochytrium sp. JEL0797]|nr:hypothetical protein HDU98_003270 [Podochytrium sp. JEL0797]
MPPPPPETEFPPLVANIPGTGAQLKRVYLIRHGETDANASGIMQGSGLDLPLSLRGKRQAVALGQRFPDTPVDLIVVSTLQRTTETANEIKKFHPNARFVVLKDLVEISWGELDGKVPTPALGELWKEWEDGNMDACAPGGESPIEVEKRAVPALYDVIRNSLPSEQNIVIVIHGRLIRILLASILNHNLRSMNTFHHANTCVNVLDAVVLDETAAKDQELKLRFVSGVTTAVNKSLLGVDKASNSLPTTPDVKTLSSFDGAVNPTKTLTHPEDIAFRAVVLNDTKHLENV